MISIIIPFKNTAHYLPECLDSILHQSYEQWEVLAVDDHSDDSSVEVLKNYANQDSRFKVFVNKGSGIIPALQTAYEQSIGDYVTRMDSDDIMQSRRLEIMLDGLKDKGLGYLSVGQVSYFSELGISNGYARYEKWLNQLTAAGKNFSEIYKECVIPSPCWMVHRTDFETCGAFYGDRYPEDYDLTFRFYEHGLQIIPCQDKIHFWRDYDSRTSRTHEHYAQNYFLDIKLHYFLNLDYDHNRPLVVWGAGFKGKTIAKCLIEKQIEFVWLCDNPNKIDKKIYGHELSHYTQLKALHNPQSIITVANGQAQIEIRNFLKSLNQEPMLDFYFFC